jgi:thioredoxin 1
MRIFISTITIVLFVTCTATAQLQLNAQDFAKEIAKPDIQLLDVRTHQEFLEGHIPNAMQANWNNKEEFISRAAGLMPQKPVYIYCLVGARSTDAAVWLQAKGFTTVQLQGGLMQWRKMQLPTFVFSAKKAGTTLAAFNESIKNIKSAVVVFSTKWCPPCKAQKPEIDKFKLSGTNSLVWELDGDENIELVKHFAIESFPTILYFEKNVLKKKHTGLLKNNEIQQWLK